MTTQIKTLPDATPVNLIAELSLTTGQDYVLTVDGQRALHLFEGANAPASGHGHLVLPGATWSFGVGTEPIWVWTHAAGTTIVVSDG